MKVILRNPSRATTRTSQITEGDAGSVFLNRSIYQTLGSLLKNKTILADYEAGSLSREFTAFLDKMELINLGTADADTIATDEALGDLGQVEEYHYSKDIIDVPDWLGTYEPYLGYREVVSESVPVTYGEEEVIYTQGYNNG